MPSYQRDENIVTRNVAGEMVLVPIRSNVGDLDAVFTVSTVGREIWNQLDKPRTLDELVEAVIREFEVAADDARRDVESFLQSLDGAGLLRRLES
jgi:hypothetical protein